MIQIHLEAADKKMHVSAQSTLLYWICNKPGQSYDISESDVSNIQKEHLHEFDAIFNSFVTCHVMSFMGYFGKNEDFFVEGRGS